MLRLAPQIGLGLDEVFLYGVLRDRTKLSAKNNWVDQSGNVYVIFPREEVMNYIGWSKGKTKQVFDRLISSGLLTEVQQKQSNVIYKPRKLFLHIWVEPSILRNPALDGYPKFTLENINYDTGAYYIVPRVFFESDELKGLNLRAIFLYCIALDKLHLSIQYGKVDDNGLVWCSIDSNDAIEELGCSARSLISYYDELEEAGLMMRIRGGAAGSGYRIYLRDYLPPGSPDLSPCEDGGDRPGPANFAYMQNLDVEHANFDHGTRNNRERNTQFLGSEHAIIGGGNAQNLVASNPPKNQNYNHLSKEVSLGAAAQPREANGKKENVFISVYNQVNYNGIFDDVKRWAPFENHSLWFYVINKCVNTIASDLVSPAEKFRIGETSVTKREIEESYRKIDEFILIAVASKIVSNYEGIRDIESYVRASLISAPIKHEGEAYHIRNEVLALRSRQS